MSPPSPRLLRVAGIVIVVLLLGVAFYPGTLTSPYVTAEDTPKYSHAIIPESSPRYEEVTANHDLTVHQYDELSPVGQELFDRTRAAEPRPQYSGERRYTPDICRSFMLVCDTYIEDELPEEFTYGTELSYEEAFVFIEDGNERHLVRTGITGHLFLAPFPVGFVLAWLTMLPLAALVAIVTVRSESRRVLGGVAGGGALVATLGVLAPYAEFAGLVPAWVIGVLLLACVWIGILSAGGHKLYRWATDSERRSTPDSP